MVVVLVLLLVLPAPDSDASPLCEHRGMDHIDRHGGKVADDLWHRDYHEQVTCTDGKDEDDRQPGERETEDAARHDELHRADHHDDNDHHVPGHDQHRWWRND